MKFLKTAWKMLGKECKLYFISSCLLMISLVLTFINIKISEILLYSNWFILIPTILYTITKDEIKEFTKEVKDRMRKDG